MNYSTSDKKEGEMNRAYGWLIIAAIMLFGLVGGILCWYESIVIARQAIDFQSRRVISHGLTILVIPLFGLGTVLLRIFVAALFKMIQERRRKNA